jgi:uncharacterized repeat protein (TIGR03803 family)
MKILRIPLAIVLVVVACRSFNASAQTETNFHSFGNSSSEGASVQAALVQGSDSNFYGTTETGGTNDLGVVFRITPSGVYTTLHMFAGFPTDGDSPQAGLVQGSDGNFYGTAVGGGTNFNGTVFRISPSGVYTNLHIFAGFPNDGSEPASVLVLGNDGNFYGTTSEGGTNNHGIIFRIGLNGTYSNLHTFAGFPSGAGQPEAGLTLGSDGNFYGTTVTGGTNNFGAVFRIGPTFTGTETVLHSFTYSPDGSNPYGALVQGSDGNFYGATAAGGTSTNGMVYRISPTGAYTNLHNFAGPPGDGADSFARLVQGSDGHFYGTTSDGGTNNVGTIFRIGLNGGYTNLHIFVGSPTDGVNPSAGMVQAIDGSFYGTTFYGGLNHSGTVFKLTVPLSPPPYPINQITSVYPAVTNVILTIPSISGETYQLQSSSSMSPTNWANVPGASISNSIGALLIVTNFGAATQPQRFYRFDITP